MKTLKQEYKLKKLNELKRRVRKSELILIENDKDIQTSLLLEALDEDEYKKATEVIEKLRKISGVAKSLNLNILPKAIEDCVKDINTFAGGDFKTKAMGQLASLFSKSAPSSNPILKGLSFASALEAGFKSLQTVVKNNIKDIQNKMDVSIISSSEEDPAIQKNISNALTKAFIPAGVFGKLFGKIPYIPDSKKLIEEIMTLTPDQINQIYEPLNSGTKAADVDQSITDEDANDAAAKKLGDKDGDEGGSEDEAIATSPGIPQKGKAKVALVSATQKAAKSAGITDGEAMNSLMKELGYELGSFEGSLVAPAITELMADKNIDADQIDGFIKGMMTDFETEFKNDIDKKIKTNSDKIKKDAADKAKKASGDPKKTPSAAEIQQAFIDDVQL